MLIIIVKQVEEMLDKNQTVTANNASKAAGRDLFDYSTTVMIESLMHDSAIENVLMGIASFTTKIEYEKPDTFDYTIEQKIDYNELTIYKNFLDDYMENYNLVKHKIIVIEDFDITFEKRLISHVKSKYIQNYTDTISSNELLKKTISDIELELKNYSELTLEDISGLHYIVFYIFAKCKIFKKPPK